MIVLFFLAILTDDAILFESDDGKDMEVIMKDLEYLSDNPIDINTASFDELIAIPYLTIVDCLKIIDYRDHNGMFDTKNDILKALDEDILLLEKIWPYVFIKQKRVEIKKIILRGRVQTEVPKCYRSEKVYTRTELSTDDYKVYSVTEKDSHEESLLDYVTGGVLVTNGVRQFALGKYNLDIGSGVILSPVGSFFNTLDFRIMTRERGILPYISTIENGGFFGAALSDSLFLHYTLFYSNQKLDGTIDSTGYARSFYTSGIHDDSIALSKKDKINEEVIGCGVRYGFHDIEISSRTYWCFYDPPFMCADSFEMFYGDRFWMTSVGIKYYGDYFIVFSEAARAFNDRLGGLFGINGYVSFVDFGLAGKYFPAGFYSPKGVESRDNYAGGVFTITGRSKIINCGTVFTLDSDLADDTTRYSVKINLEKQVGILNTQFQMRWKYEASEMNVSGSRIMLRLKPAKPIFVDIRLEEKYAYIDSGIEKGLFGAFEFGIKLKRAQARIRYGLFDTESYAARIFAYEIDLPGVINNRMLYQKGSYGFIYVSCNPIDILKVHFKYSTIRRDTLTHNAVGCQIDIRL